MKNPTFDKDGYPTEETLEKIRTWSLKTNQDVADLFSYCKECWRFPEYFKIESDQVSFSTIGWSGNEDVVAAMEENYILKALCWLSSQRGGYYKYKNNPYTK